MAEDEGNTAEPQQPNGNDTAPRVGVISQYVKDLSFENPNAPAVYQWQSQPKIEVDFNIGSNKLNDEIFEVVLRIEVRATADGQTAFAVDLMYAGLIESQRGPRTLMPSCSPRRAILSLRPARSSPRRFRRGGFPPLRPIDRIHALYVASGELGGSGPGRARGRDRTGPDAFRRGHRKR